MADTRKQIAKQDRVWHLFFARATVSSHPRSFRGEGLKSGSLQAPTQIWIVQICVGASSESNSFFELPGLLAHLCEKVPSEGPY
jgi:hypothetical protein